MNKKTQMNTTLEKQKCAYNIIKNEINTTKLKTKPLNVVGV